MQPVVAIDPRTDRTGDRRRLGWYFGGLLAVYVGALIAFRPAVGEDPNALVFLLVMYAPTIGALFARFRGPGVIVWGRPSWWILGGFIPPIAGLATYYAASVAGWIAVDEAVLRSAIIGSGTATLLAMILAAGEEVGWRGFLWPLLRNRTSFLRASLAIGVIWWLYHVPFVLFGWYGSVSGLPAFTVALIGFTLFVGVLTDRSRSVWPSIVAHGSWNALVATGFAIEVGRESIPAFSGHDALVGEFGWLAAVTMLATGVVFTWWHLRSPMSPGTAAMSSQGSRPPKGR